MTNHASRITDHSAAETIVALLFDLDGTLIDSKADLARSINLMLADVGRPALSEDVVGAFVGDGVRVLVRRCLAQTDPQHKDPNPELHSRAIELMHEHYAKQMLVSTRLYPGVAQTLAVLPQRKALVTSKEVRFARIILDHFQVAQFFHAIVGGDTVPARKPDPAPVIEGLRLLGSNAARAVMVGDSENDVMAGKRAGTRTCAVTYGFRNAEQMKQTNPDFVADHFEQLRAFFL
jgi:phosphoglycolate phosphatase